MDTFHYNLNNYQNIETPHYIQIIIMTLPYKKPINKKGNRHKTRGNNPVKSTNSKHNQSDTIHIIYLHREP